MTSSLLRIRRERPCSPSAHRRASARLDFPDPLGPTTALMPGPNSTRVRSAKDLNPWTRRPRRRAGALTSRRPVVVGDRGRRRQTAVVASAGRSGARRGAGSAEPRAARQRSISSASAAADVSAIRRDGPSPTPSTRPSTTTSIRNCFSWSGPTASSSRYSGRSPVVRWVCSWSRLLGLLSVVSAESAESSSAAQRWIQSARRVPAEVEVDGADERLEGRGEQRRAHAAAALGLALAEEQERARGPAARRGAPGRACSRSPRGARKARPRRRPGGAGRAPRTRRG